MQISVRALSIQHMHKVTASIEDNLNEVLEIHKKVHNLVDFGYNFVLSGFLTHSCQNVLYSKFLIYFVFNVLYYWSKRFQHL